MSPEQMAAYIEARIAFGDRPRARIRTSESDRLGRVVVEVREQVPVRGQRDRVIVRRWLACADSLEEVARWQRRQFSLELGLIAACEAARRVGHSYHELARRMGRA